jgi:hypothetical protein
MASAGDILETRAPPRRLREFARAALVIGAVWLFTAGGRTATDVVVPWDSKNQFYAFFRFLALAFHSGEWPFWNPFHYAGHPSVADPQSLIFAPGFLLWAWLDPAPSLRTFDLLVSAHLLVGGLALAAIGWRARWPATACVLAAVLFMYGGAAAGRLQHTGLILAYSLFPPALLLLELALDRRSVLIAAAFAAVASALVLNRNQVALLLAILLLVAAVRKVVTAERPWTYLRTRFPMLATMAVIGTVLVAAPLLLTIQFAALSNRPRELLATALLGSLHPANLAQLAVADIFGSHSDYFGPSAVTAPQVALTDDSFNYLFVGSIPLVLLLWFGVAGRGLWRSGRRLLTGVLLAALTFALGRYTPLFGLMYQWVPGVSLFRRPVDGNFVVIAALAPLVGFLLADYMRDGVPRASLTARISVGAVAALAVAYGIMFAARTGHAGDSIVATIETVPIAAGAILVLAYAQSIRARAVAAAVVTAVATVDLLWWNAAFRLNAEPRSLYAVLDTPASDDARVIDAVDDAVRSRRAAGERPRIEVYGMGGPWQNLAMVRGFEADNGYNPLRIGRYDRLVRPGESNWLVELREFPPTFDSYDCPLARALGLEFLVLGRPIEEMPHLVKRPAADVLMAGPRAWIYRLRNPLPRLKFSAHVVVADAEAITATGQLMETLSSDRVLIDAATRPARSYDGPQDARTGTARIVDWHFDRVAIDTMSKQAAVLVLHDPYYPGWIAEIDGHAVPVLRADMLFRGVEVPAGSHRVILRFAPFAPANLLAAIKLTVEKRALAGD